MPTSLGTSIRQPVSLREVVAATEHMFGRLTGEPDHGVSITVNEYNGEPEHVNRPLSERDMDTPQPLAEWKWYSFGSDRPTARCLPSIDDDPYDEQCIGSIHVDLPRSAFGNILAVAVILGAAERWQTRVYWERFQLDPDHDGLEDPKRLVDYLIERDRPRDVLDGVLGVMDKIPGWYHGLGFELRADPPPGYATSNGQPKPGDAVGLAGLRTGRRFHDWLAKRDLSAWSAPDSDELDGMLQEITPAQDWSFDSPYTILRGTPSLDLRIDRGRLEVLDRGQIPVVSRFGRGLVKIRSWLFTDE